ncbi:hypothetical protein ES703_105685 [subsurface metagenome]
MKYIGLLKDEQKRAGYFISQDDDFIWLWHGLNGKANLLAVFPYDTATVKEIRDKAEEHLIKYSTKKVEQGTRGK